MRVPKEAVLLCLAPLVGPTVSGGECIDFNGRAIQPGFHYVPGPDACMLCECKNGSPIWCKSVLCAPPQDCKSFRVGNSCCEYICMDDSLPKSDGDSTDLGLRLIASAITAIFALSLLFFLIHRLRKRKIRGRQNRQLTEEQRSLGSIGYIAGSIGYLPGSMGYLGNQENLDFPYDSDPRSNFALWKPPEHYFPRGEAPPPYEEAVAAAHAEAMAAAMSTAPSAPNYMVMLPSSTLQRPSRHVDIIPNLSSLPPPPEPPPDVLHAIRSDAFYEDVPLPPPSSLVEYVNVEQTRSPEVASSNLAAMNDLNKSTCSCPDENDDYRSECENCQSTLEQDVPPHETMTLQRRPPSLTVNTANGYGTSLTLPSQGRRLRDEGRGANLLALVPFSVQLPPPHWTDSSSSSRSPSPEQRRSKERRTSVSSEGLGEASTHM